MILGLDWGAQLEDFRVFGVFLSLFLSRVSKVIEWFEGFLLLYVFCFFSWIFEILQCFFCVCCCFFGFPL